MKIQPSAREISTFSNYLIISFSAIALFGLGICFYLISIPSDTKNTFFMGLSKTRLLLIAINLFAISILFFLSNWLSKNKVEIAKWFVWFKQPAFWAISFLFALCGTIFLLAGLLIPLKAINLLGYEAFRERLTPNLLWVFTICVWMLVTSILGYWYSYVTQPKGTTNLANTPRKTPSIHYIDGFLVLLFLFAIIRSYTSFPYPIWGGDSDDYLYGAGKSLFNLEFYAGPRPWATSLIYKIVGADLEITDYVDPDGIIKNHRNADAVLFVQNMIHVICWIALALISAPIIKIRLLRLITVGIILSIGLSPPVVTWNHMLLSESLSISLMVMLLAIWIWLLTKGWNWHNAFLMFVITIFWVFTRESNALLILTLTGVLIPVGLVIKRQRVCLVVAALFILLYISSSHLSDIRNRWAVPLGNVIFHRVLPNQDALEFFMGQGMPLNSTILEMEGKWVCDDGCAFLKEAKYKVFRDWLFENGRKIYIRYLFSNVEKSLIAPFIHLDKLTEYALSPPNLPGYKAPIPKLLSDILFLNGAVLFWCTSTLVIIAFSFSKLRTNPAVLVVCVFFLLAYPHAFFSYHGDEMEIGRHSIQFSIQLRLCFWLLFMLVLNFVVINKVTWLSPINRIGKKFVTFSRTRREETKTI